MIEERRLQIPAQIEAITQACDFVVAAAETAGLDEHGVYQCRLAVDEAVTNIIEHGYEGAGAPVEVRCTWGYGDFTITLVDEGPPFDPLHRQDPDPNQPLDERGQGGWGIFFIKKMMDDVRYARRDGRNWLEMVKTAPMPSHAATTIDGIMRQEIQPHVWVVSPHGRLDSTSSRPFEAALQDELDAGHTCLVVDMGQVVYISSSGLKALVSAWRRARDLEGAVVIAGMQPRVREVFNTVGFDRVFDTFVSMDEAVNAIGAGKIVPGCGC